MDVLEAVAGSIAANFPALVTPDDLNDSVRGERRRVKRAYDSYAARPRKQRSWSAENAGNLAIRAELVHAVYAIAGPALLEASEILDIGCGSGWWLELLATQADLHASLHGVEILPERVEAARNRAPAATVAIADARQLPYPDGRFEVTSLFTVLSSLAGRADVELAVSEAKRVTAPGGVLIVWEPRLPNPMNATTSLIGGRALRGLLGRATIETRTTTLLPPLARRLGLRTRQWYPRLGRIPLLRSHRLLCARLPPSGDG